MYEAVFFDLDGTLVDTETLALRSNRLVFEAHGQAVEDDFLHSMIGKDLAAMQTILRRSLPGVDMARFSADLDLAFQQELERGLELKPGAKQLLSHLKMPLALVTSSRKRGAWHKLEMTGIAGFFAEVITVEDVARPKPAGDPYLLAAARLGVNPAHCLVFEDSEIGAEAGRNAGCRVVQLRDVLPPSGRWADHIADDLLSGAHMAGLMA